MLIVSGDILLKNLAIFIFQPGIIKNFPFKVLFIAYLATYSLDKLFNANFTFATLLKFVFTGPGHKTLILTFDLSFFNSSFIA